MSEPCERLKQARIAAGYATSQALSRRVGLAGPTVRAHESGQNGIRPDAAAKYADALGVSREWLLYGGEEARPSTTAPVKVQPPVTVSQTAPGRVRVRLTIDTEASIGVAAQILALIEGDKP